MSPSVYTPIVPGDRRTTCSIGEDLPSSQWPVSGGPEARGERHWGTFEAVEDLEASLLPEARTGVPVEYLSVLVPVITSCGIKEDHLDLQVMRLHLKGL